MGGGLSMPAGNHSPELIKEIQDEYEKQKASGLSEEALHQHMSTYYSEIVKKHGHVLSSPRGGSVPSIHADSTHAHAHAPTSARGTTPRHPEEHASHAHSTTTTTTAAAAAATSHKTASRPSSSEANKHSSSSSSTNKASAPVKSALPAGKPKGKMEATRRRSFGPDIKAALAAPAAAAVAAVTAASSSGSPTKPKEEDKTLLSSASTGVLATAPTSTAAAATTTTTSPSSSSTTTDSPAQDHWESVREQPYCKICAMAFKTPAFLERHVKYSDLHANNVKKAASGGSDNTLVVKLKAAQEEGVHYRLMYSGSKFFWRSQVNVDLNIYYHILPDTIEVIPFDVEGNKEDPRLYFSYTHLKSFLNHEIQAKLDSIKAEAVTQTSPTELAASDEEIARICLTTYILNRLQKTAHDPTAFVKTSSDPEKFEHPFLLEHPPAVLVPVSVARRRRTNAEEIDNAINTLATNIKASAEAAEKASRIVDIMHSSMSVFTTKKWWDHLNPVRRRWIIAIRKVIRQKLVIDTIKYLQTINFHFYSKQLHKK